MTLDELNRKISENEKLIIKNLDEKLYHGSFAISRSDICNAMTSEDFYLYKRIQPNVQSDSMLRGSTLHCLFLEPHLFEERFFVLPEDLNLRTKAGKEEKQRAEQDHPDKTIISSSLFSLCNKMVQKLNNHPTVKALFSPENGGENEISYFYKDPKNGLHYKARADREVRGLKTLIDLKTSKDASPQGFARAIKEYNYDVQADHYLDIARKATGHDFTDFVFVVIESLPPHGIAIYTLQDESIEIGAEIRKICINRIANVKDREINPFIYSTEIKPISLPGYGFDVMNRVGGES